MDPRTAAHVLTQISDLLELSGENRFKSRAYRSAASAVLEVNTDDLCPMYRDGSLARLKGIGPATLGVIADLCDTGESRYFDQLREQTPEGLLELLRVPGLGISKIHALHEGLGIASVEELEAAAREGRLAKLKGFGPKTAERILKGITHLRSTNAYILYPHALIEARRLLAMVEAHPEVERALIAGSIRRRRETGRDIDVVRSEAAAREGRLAKLKGFGPKTAERILKGITHLRSTNAYILYPHALIEARRLLAMVEAHPEVERALIAGSIRRRRETVRDIDVVAACRTTPAAVAASFAHAGGVKEVIGA